MLTNVEELSGLENDTSHQTKESKCQHLDATLQNDENDSLVCFLTKPFHCHCNPNVPSYNAGRTEECFKKTM